jgi:hypothetical protein
MVARGLRFFQRLDRLRGTVGFREIALGSFRNFSTELDEFLVGTVERKRLACVGRVVVAGTKRKLVDAEVSAVRRVYDCVDSETEEDAVGDLVGSTEPEEAVSPVCGADAAPRRSVVTFVSGAGPSGVAGDVAGCMDVAGAVAGSMEGRSSVGPISRRIVGALEGARRRRCVLMGDSNLRNWSRADSRVYRDFGVAFGSGAVLGDVVESLRVLRERHGGSSLAGVAIVGVILGSNAGDHREVLWARFLRALRDCGFVGVVRVWWHSLWGSLRGMVLPGLTVHEWYDRRVDASGKHLLGKREYLVVFGRFYGVMVG